MLLTLGSACDAGTSGERQQGSKDPCHALLQHSTAHLQQVLEKRLKHGFPVTAQLAEAYTVAGNDNDALVIPAGLAFAKARQRQSDLNLYAPDKRHPSLAGTYLAACTVYAALTGQSPVGNAYHAGIDPETATFLQTTAWNTVQEYYGK